MIRSVQSLGCGSPIRRRHHVDVASDVAAGREARDVVRYVDALAATIFDEALDPAYRALCLTLPSEDELAGEMGERPGPDGAPTPADPDAIPHGADNRAPRDRRIAARTIGAALS